MSLAPVPCGRLLEAPGGRPVGLVICGRAHGKRQNLATTQLKAQVHTLGTFQIHRGRGGDGGEGHRAMSVKLFGTDESHLEETQEVLRQG